MTLWPVFWAAGAMVVVALSRPVKIYLKSNMVCLIQWLFLGLVISYRNKGVIVELRFLKARRRFKKTPKPVSDSTPRDSDSSLREASRPRTNIYLFFAKLLLKNPETRKLIYKIFRLSFRFARAFRITLFKCNIGLKDYYRQGMLSGALCALPVAENFRISGNFAGVNSFVLGLRLSLWKALWALTALVVCFPYLKAFRFYKKITNRE